MRSSVMKCSSNTKQTHSAFNLHCIPKVKRGCLDRKRCIPFQYNGVLQHLVHSLLEVSRHMGVYLNRKTPWPWLGPFFQEVFGRSFYFGLEAIAFRRPSLVGWSTCHMFRFAQPPPVPSPCPGSAGRRSRMSKALHHRIAFQEAKMQYNLGIAVCTPFEVVREVVPGVFVMGCVSK